MNAIMMLVKGNPIFMGIVGALILGLGIYVGALKLMLGDARGDVSALRGVVSGLKSENTALEQSILSWRVAYADLNIAAQQCSNAVSDLEKQGDALKMRAAEADKRYQAISSARQPLINAVRGREITGRGTCEDAIQDAKADLIGEMK